MFSSIYEATGSWRLAGWIFVFFFIIDWLCMIVYCYYEYHKYLNKLNSEEGENMPLLKNKTKIQNDNIKIENIDVEIENKLGK